MSESKTIGSDTGIYNFRPSSSRGHASYGWLNTYHTFSFANWHDRRYENIRSLRVINEDRIAARTGFPKHSHADFEIFSYVVSGELLHEDSMGNKEKVPRGAVQFTTAGTGISHSEFAGDSLTHMLQIWVRPNKRGLPPGYQLKTFPDSEKEGKLKLFVSPVGAKDGKGTIRINQKMRVYASILKNGESVSMDVAPGQDLYVHLIQDPTGMSTEADKTVLDVNGRRLRGGDGLHIQPAPKSGPLKVTFTGAHEADGKSEFLVFDIGA